MEATAAEAAGASLGHDHPAAGSGDPGNPEAAAGDPAGLALDGDPAVAGLPLYERVPIDSIFPDPDNARRHPERNLQAIAALLAEVGQQKPVVVQRSNRRILAGNGAHEAARDLLGWTEIDVRWSDLEGEAADRYALGDNRTGELSEWDYEALSRKFKELQESGAGFQGLGWEDFEVQPLLAAEWKPPTPTGTLGTEEHGGAGGIGQHGIHLTGEQRAVIDQAIAKIRVQVADDGGPTGENLTDGRCLELICADFLAGAD